MITALPSRGRALARARSTAGFGRALEGEVLPAAKSAEPMAFSLGDPEPVLNRREFMDHLECWPIQGVGGRYYAPPVSRDLLSKTANVTSHHSSAFRVKVNQLLRDFIPTPILDLQTFEGLVLDHLVFGDYFVERVNNLAGRAMKLKRSLARYTRAGVEPGQFVFLSGFMKEHWFAPDTVFHGMQPWLDQEIYGMPEYLGGLQSAFLNEGATLFRRRYFLNGAHAGFVMYVGKGGLAEDDADKIRSAIRDTKGVGNFKSLFLHLPQGEKDSVQILHPRRGGGARRVRRHQEHHARRRAGGASRPAPAARHHPADGRRVRRRREGGVGVLSDRDNPAAAPFPGDQRLAGCRSGAVPGTSRTLRFDIHLECTAVHRRPVKLDRDHPSPYD